MGAARRARPHINIQGRSIAKTAAKMAAPPAGPWERLVPAAQPKICSSSCSTFCVSEERATEIHDLLIELIQARDYEEAVDL